MKGNQGKWNEPWFKTFLQGWEVLESLVYHNSWDCNGVTAEWPDTVQDGSALDGIKYK